MCILGSCYTGGRLQSVIQFDIISCCLVIILFSFFYQAKQLFLRGTELERSGKLYEAVQYYKKAVQLLPDVEARLYQNNDTRAQTPEGTNLKKNFTF